MEGGRQAGHGLAAPLQAVEDGRQLYSQISLNPSGVLTYFPEGLQAAGGVGGGAGADTPGGGGGGAYCGAPGGAGGGGGGGGDIAGWGATMTPGTL